MKKVLSFVLAVLMVVSVFPLTLFLAFAEESITPQAEDSYSGYTPMANTLYKLIEEGELTVGYIGDSIGAGQTTSHASYPEYAEYGTRNSKTYQTNPMVFTKVFTDWIEWYAEDELGVENVDIDPYYSAIGGATIAQALSYIEEDICVYTPDLVIIEIYNSIDNSELYFESVLQQIYASNPYCDVIVFSAVGGQCTGWKEIKSHYGVSYIDALGSLQNYLTRTDIFGDGVSFNETRKYYFGDYPHTHEEGYAYISKALIDGVEALFERAKVSEHFGKYSITQPADKIITMNGDEVIYPTNTVGDDLYYYADILYFADEEFEYDSSWKVTGTEKNPLTPAADNKHGTRYMTATADGATITLTFVGTAFRVYSINGNGAYSVYEVDENGNVISTIAENKTWASGYFTVSEDDEEHIIKIVANKDCPISFVSVYGKTYRPAQKVTANEMYSVNYYGRLKDEEIHDDTLNGYNILPKYLTYISFTRTDTYSSAVTAPSSSILHSDVDSTGFVGWIEADGVVFYEGEKFPIVYPYTYNEGDAFVTLENGTEKALYKEGDSIALDGNLDLVAAYATVPAYAVTVADGEEDTTVSTTDVFVFPEIEAGEGVVISFTDGENTYVAGDVICVSESTTFEVVRDTSFNVTVKDGNMTVAQGQTTGSYTLPDALTGALDYMIFEGWSDGENTYLAGTTVTVNKNTVFTAVWKESVVLHEHASMSWWTSSTHSATLQNTTDTVIIDFVIENFGNISGESKILTVNGVSVVKIDGSRNAYVGEETESHITFSNQWKAATIKVTVIDLSTGEAVVDVKSDGKSYSTTIMLGEIGSTVTLSADKKANNASDKISQLVDVRPRYTVTYTDGEIELGTETALGSVVLPSFEIADTHKILVGWTDGTTNYNIGDTVEITKDTTFTAIIETVYNATFTGDGVEETSEKTNAAAQITLMAAPARDGFEFLGWSDGTTTYAAGTTLTLVDDTTFTAVWKELGSAVVSFYDGDKLISGPATVQGTVTMLAALTPDNDYATFAGWSDGKNTYAAGATINVSEDTVFTAVWKESVVLHECASKQWWTGGTHSATLQNTTDTVIIDFVIENFGNISGESEILTVNGVSVVKIDGSRNAYVGEETESHITFSNQWKSGTINVTITDLSTGEATVQVKSDGKSYTTTMMLGEIGSTVKLSGTSKPNYASDKIIQIVDVRPRYTVTYTDGEIELGTETALGSVVLPSFEIEDTHKILVGWTDGTNNYAIGDTVEITGNTTFTAIIETVYTATFGGEDVAESTQKTNAAGQVTLISAPSRDGFEFLGWSDGVATYAAGETVTLVDDTTFTAVWKKLVYVNVSFFDGDQLISGPTTVLGNITMPAALTPDKDYVIFAGWSDGEKTYAAGETVTVNEDTVFTAVWKESVLIHETSTDNYWWHKSTHSVNLLNTTDTVIVEFNVQIGSTGASTILKINDKDVVRIDASRKGYIGDETTSGLTFDQWATSNIKITITDLSTGEATVYIKSKNSTYTTTIMLGEIGSTVTLKGDSSLGATSAYDKVYQLVDARPRYSVTINDEDGQLISSEVTLGEVTLPVPEFRDGFAFRGWSDGASLFEAGSKVTVTADTTFTAVWEAVDVYEITFTYGEETVVENWTAEKEYSFPTDIFTRDGYVLNGWKNSLGKYFGPGETIIPTKNEIYTAIWGLEYSAIAGLNITDSYPKVSKEGNSGLMIEASVAKPAADVEFTEFGIVFVQSAGLTEGKDLVISGIYTFTEEKKGREVSANVVNAKNGIYTEDDGAYYFDVLLTDFWYQYLIQTNISVRTYAKAMVDGVETIYYGDVVKVDYFDKTLEEYNDPNSDLTQEEKEILYMSVLNFGDLIVRNWVDSSKTKPMGDNYPAIQSSATLGYKQLSNLLYKIQNNEDIVIGYLGGSITEGQTSQMPNGNKDSTLKYANQVTAWLKTYAQSIGSTSSVSMVNAGISGTASHFGLARIHKDLFVNDTVVPDLVFIEYSSNDWLDYATGNIIDQVTRFESIIKEIYEYNPKTDIIMLSTNRYGLTNPNDPNMTTYIMQTLAKYYNLVFINAGTHTYSLGINEVYTAIKAELTYAEFMASGEATDENGLTVLTEEIYTDMYDVYYGAKELLEVRKTASIDTTTTYEQYLALLGSESYMDAELYATVLKTCAGANYGLDNVVRNRGIAWAMSDFLHPTSFGYTMYTKVITSAITDVLAEADELDGAVNVPAPARIYGDAVQYLVNDLYSVKEEGLLENLNGWQFKVNGNYKWAKDNTAIISETVGSSFEFDFTGTGFALVEDNAHKNKPVILEYSVDGGEYKRVTLADGNSPQMYLFANGLEYGDHHVTVRYAEGTGLANISAIYVFSRGVQILSDGTIKDYETDEYNVFSFRNDVVFDDSSLYFTITYHESTESGAQTQEVKLEKGSIIEGLMACPWTKDGYVFAGWIDMATGELITNETFKLEDDLDLVASWIEAGLDVIFAHSVSFHNNLTLNYYVDAAALEGYENIRLVVEKDKYTGGVHSTTETTLYGTLTADGYKFVYAGIAAAEIADEVRATVYAEKDGVTYVSEQDAYSVKTYAYNRLAATENESFKTLLVDMLNYCAASQIYFGYRADGLVNADLTAEQKAFGTQSDAAVSSTIGRTTLEGATASVYGISALFNSNVELRFYLDLSNYDDISNISFKIVYGEKVTVINSDRFVYDESTGCYTVKYRDIPVSELRGLMDVTIVAGDEAISDTITYSIETYVNSRLQNSTDEVFKNLLKELMKYSDSARNYFR